MLYSTLLTIAIAVGSFALLAVLILLFFVIRAITTKPTKSFNTSHQSQQLAEETLRDKLRPLLHRWTYFDYAIILLFGCSMIFLAVDLMAVMRERDAYPFYHLGYLASGFIFSLVSMLFMLIRLGLVISLGRASSHSSSHQHDHPAETNRTEQGIQSGDKVTEANLTN